MNQRLVASLQHVLLAVMKFDLREFRQAVLVPGLYADLLLPPCELAPPRPGDASFLPRLSAAAPSQSTD